MSNYITIPLSKTGKHAGKFEAIVSVEDATELLQYNWTVMYPYSKTQYAYRRVRIEGNKQLVIYMHREVLRLKLERPLEKGEEADHINHNGLDNRRDNIRLATSSQNKINVGKRADNTSGYKGVTWKKANRNWCARIRVKGKIVWLGTFDTAELADEACRKAREMYHGEFARDS